MGRASLIVLLFNKEVPERERLDALLLLFIEDFLATLQREFKNQFQNSNPHEKCIEKKKIIQGTTGIVACIFLW